jgi:hypothetical protein
VLAPLSPPILTVVTVTKDDPSGLDVTGQSIESQRHARIEWIVVDGSTSSQPRRVRTTSNPLIMVRQIQEPDDGPYDAMNKGLASASGETIVFINSGDRLHDVTTAARLIASYTQRQWAWGYGPVLFVSDQGSQVHFPRYSHWRQVLGLRGLCHQGVVCQTRLLRRVGGFSESAGMVADQAVFAALGSIQAPYKLPFVVADFRLGGMSSTVTPSSLVFGLHQARVQRGRPLAKSALLDVLVARTVCLRFKIPMRLPNSRRQVRLAPGERDA